MMVEIRKPEMTKKISTPMKPPFIDDGKAWNMTTERTATARRPSMSARYFGWLRWASDADMGEGNACKGGIRGAPRRGLGMAAPGGTLLDPGFTRGNECPLSNQQA